jgi:hypothetical protein
MDNQSHFLVEFMSNQISVSLAVSGRDRMVIGFTTIYAISAYTTDESSNLNQGKV